jgi:hypothetical protein
MKTCTMIVLVCAFFFSLSPWVCAQEEEAYEGDYTYGTVMSVSTDEIVLSQYDLETDEEKQEHYLITTETELYNFERIDELSQKDAVEIFFFEEDGLRYAIYIAKE